MKTRSILTAAGLAAGTFLTLVAQNVSLETAPPVVVSTVPVAGATDVDPGLTELRVTFSKPMKNGSWSWSTWGEENFPEIAGDIKYLEDQRTCVLPVKLKPGKFYATWLNSQKFGNFKDASGRSAVPYLLSFTTTGDAAANSPQDRPRLEGVAARAANAPDTTQSAATASPARPNDTLLNDSQRAVLAWTDRQFGSFFDARTFDGWSEKERTDLEKRMLDALKGPRSPEYYRAINTLAALNTTNALPALREIAFERVDGNNRNRWMCVRSLGLMGDKASVPDLIHLVYHGNQNTHWWAQITLVRLTGQNFGGDWNVWGKWWDESGGQPPFKPEIIRWWNGQAEPDKLAASLAEGDQKFLDGLKAK